MLDIIHLINYFYLLRLLIIFYLHLFLKVSKTLDISYTGE